MKIDKGLLKEALYIFVAEDNTAIDTFLETAPKPPDELYRYGDEIAQKISERDERALPFKKAVTILIAAALIISLLAVVTYAKREKIGGFYIEFLEKYVKLTTDEKYNPNMSSSDVMIEYIPDGYTETRKKLGIQDGLYEGKNGDNIISLIFSSNPNLSGTTDNENSNFIVLELDGLTLFRTEKYGHFSVTWTDGEVTYILTANGLEWDEMVKVIKGIKLNTPSPEG